MNTKNHFLSSGIPFNQILTNIPSNDIFLDPKISVAFKLWFVAQIFTHSIYKHLFSSWGNWRTAWENWTRVWHKNEARSESRTRMCFDVHIYLSACIAHIKLTLLILDLRRVVWYNLIMWVKKVQMRWT